MKAVPLADVGSFGGAARRTRLVRAALAVALAALVLAAAALARHPRTSEHRFLPPGSSGIVVLDLSASVSTDTFSRIGATLGDLAASHGRYGLVVFSDVAYEALPPGTPAAELGPIARYFRIRNARSPNLPPAFPTNPWAQSFTSGTRISSGLDLARSIALHERLRHPAVLLISDLDDDPGDLARLAATALSYRRLGFALRVVALNPSPENERAFQRLLPDRNGISHARLRARAEASSRTALPRALLVLAVAVAAFLAAFELWSAWLTWRPEATPA